MAERERGERGFDGPTTHDIYTRHNPLTQQDNKMSTRTFLIRTRYNNLYAWHVSEAR